MSTSTSTRDAVAQRAPKNHYELVTVKPHTPTCSLIIQIRVRRWSMDLEDLMCTSLVGNYGGQNKEAKSQITARTFVAAPLPVPSPSTLRAD